MSSSQWIEDEALVLRKVEYGDSSLILHLFTRHHGIVATIAKGAHRIKNPLWGMLDLPAYLKVQYQSRPNREIQLLAEAKLLESYSKIRNSLDRFYIALYVIELLQEAGIPAGSQELFALAQSFFSLLNSEETEPGTLLIAFEIEFLKITGLEPSLENCARCGRAFQKNERKRFFPNAGGMLCSSCIQTGDREEKIPDAALNVLTSLVRNSWDQAPRIHLPPLIRAQIRRALDSFIRYHWERMPRTHRQVVAIFHE